MIRNFEHTTSCLEKYISVISKDTQPTGTRTFTVGALPYSFLIETSTNTHINSIKTTVIVSTAHRD
jgi:hypothetical protein